MTREFLNSSFALLASLPLIFLHWAELASSTFVMGVTHPLRGIDHLLAMTAVGLWGATVGGRALWVWPIAFVAAMLAGFALGISGFSLPMVEPAIAASIVALGLCIAFALRAPVWLGASLTGLFAVFHGHAHGTEAVGMGSEVIAYVSGLALSTAALHVAGIALGLRVSTLARRQIGYRTVGGLVALAGIGQFVILT